LKLKADLVLGALTCEPVPTAAADNYAALRHAVEGKGLSIDDKIGRFMTQFEEVRDKLRRTHFKSLGAILALQERIASNWSGQQTAAPLH
jgi:hypothetical protein